VVFTLQRTESPLLGGVGAGVGAAVAALALINAATVMRLRCLVSTRGWPTVTYTLDNNRAKGYRCTDGYDVGLSWVRGSTEFDEIGTEDLAHARGGATSLRGRWLPCGRLTVDGSPSSIINSLGESGEQDHESP
jgi:hypothetical protein